MMLHVFMYVYFVFYISSEEGGWETRAMVAQVAQGCFVSPTHPPLNQNIPSRGIEKVNADQTLEDATKQFFHGLCHPSHNW